MLKLFYGIFMFYSRATTRNVNKHSKTQEVWWPFFKLHVRASLTPLMWKTCSFTATCRWICSYCAVLGQLYKDPVIKWWCVDKPQVSTLPFACNSTCLCIGASGALIVLSTSALGASSSIYDLRRCCSLSWKRHWSLDFNIIGRCRWQSFFVILFGNKYNILDAMCDKAWLIFFFYMYVVFIYLYLCICFQCRTLMIAGKTTDVCLRDIAV